MLGAAAGCISPFSAHAEIQCTQPNPRGVQVCIAGVSSLRFFSALQECPQWCWAASIQMIFATQGRVVPQTSIVQRLFPDLRCSPANGPQIVNAVNSGPWQDQEGNTFLAQASPLADLSFGISNPLAAAQAAQELAAGRPLINGALGHATVMSAMRYARDAYGNGRPLEILVRDPWPGNQHRRRLTAQEIHGTVLLISVFVN